ncbi:MAG: hypothetical protein OEV06_05165 [Anaerolineae bacterium]|nr:hypothetical protein [Anaerolineae bacterium]
MSKEISPSKNDIQRILDSAKRLGVEIDEADALQWLTAVAAAAQDEIVVDERAGVFGHRISMLDFSSEDLEHFRILGHLVEFHDIPGKVETALALSGSAAQAKIQTYPGDADFFERVNIKAESREAACAILGEIMRDKALTARKGPTYELMEARLGSYPYDMLIDGDWQTAGTPISWTAASIEHGAVEGENRDGDPVSFTWEQAAQDPGWCKLDWVVVDLVRRQLVNASNMLDATWEAPDGTITPLDGYMDPYFQEVYLEAESIPLFSKLVKHVSSDALDEYVAQLEREVKKYLTKSPNFGKAAKRMYNIFRLTGRYGEAAYLRELFDEPATLLYQVWALIRTIDECFNPGSNIDLDTLLAHCDELIIGVTEVLEGEHESEIVRLLLRLRDHLSREKPSDGLSPAAEAARLEVINIVNNFFYEKMTGVPEIKAYMDDIQARAAKPHVRG